MTNHHGCVVEIAGIGIFITGASGSGKTSLMLSLLEHAYFVKIPAKFICDDQTILKQKENCLYANAPHTISGQIELRGYGIIHMQNEVSTRLDLVVELISDEELERLPHRLETRFEGVTLPKLQVPIRHETAARRIVFAWINAHNSNEQ